MTPTDEALLYCWQSNRDTDRAVVAFLLDDCLQPADYTRELDLVRNCMCEEFEMTFEEEDEAALAFALVGFRTMNVDMRSAFLVGAMDEMCRMAREGEVDDRLASQILVRAQLIASAPKKEAA